MGGINSCADMGSGRQEQFYNCADVAIVPKRSDTLFERPLLSLHENIYLVPHELTYNLTNDELELLKDEIRKISPGMKQTIPNGFLEPLEFNFTFPMPVDTMFGKGVNGLNQPPFWWLENATLGDHTHEPAHEHPSQKVKTPPPIKPVQTKPPPNILIKGLSIPPPPSIELLFEDGINESRTKPPSVPMNERTSVATSKKSPMYAIGDSFVFPMFKKTLIRDPANVVRTTTTAPVVTDSALSGAGESCTVFSPKFHCVGRGQYKDTAGISEWCLDHCQREGCVEFMCECGCHKPVTKKQCRATGSFQMLPNMNEWCTRLCKTRSSCPPNICNVNECVPTRR